MKKIALTATSFALLAFVSMPAWAQRVKAGVGAQASSGTRVNTRVAMPAARTNIRANQSSTLRSNARIRGSQSMTANESSQATARSNMNGAVRGRARASQSQSLNVKGSSQASVRSNKSGAVRGTTRASDSQSLNTKADTNRGFSTSSGLSTATSVKTHSRLHAILHPFSHGKKSQKGGSTGN
jgi:hypothetical protein